MNGQATDGKSGESSTSGNTSSAPASTPAASGNSGSNSSQSPTINIGMGPKKAPQQQSNTRLSGDQLFQEYGEEIFKHDRFKELTGFKQQYETIAPLIQELGSADEVQRLAMHFGPVWKAFAGMDASQANTVWQKIYPVLAAIAQGQSIDQFFPAQVQTAKTVVDSADLDDDDPLKRKLDEVSTQFNEFKNQTEQEKLNERRAKLQKTATDNYQKYEGRFAEKAKAIGIPETAIPFLGDIMTNRIIRYMPKDRMGKPLNPVFSYNEQAFDTCWEKEIMVAYKNLSQAGVTEAVNRTKNGGPSIPNSHTQGSAASSSGAPGSRQEKAARMTQFLQKGR